MESAALHCFADHFDLSFHRGIAGVLSTGLTTLSYLLATCVPSARQLDSPDSTCHFRLCQATRICHTNAWRFQRKTNLMLPTGITHTHTKEEINTGKCRLAFSRAISRSVSQSVSPPVSGKRLRPHSHLCIDRVSAARGTHPFPDCARAYGY